MAPTNDTPGPATNTKASSVGRQVGMGVFWTYFLSALLYDAYLLSEDFFHFHGIQITPKGYGWLPYAFLQILLITVFNRSGRKFSVLGVILADVFVLLLLFPLGIC